MASPLRMIEPTTSSLTTVTFFFTDTATSEIYTLSLHDALPILNELERQGLMSWRSEEHAWVADPNRVVQALVDGGFQEYKREIAKDNRSHATSGGMWQG